MRVMMCVVSALVAAQMNAGGAARPRVAALEPAVHSYGPARNQQGQQPGEVVGLSARSPRTAPPAHPGPRQEAIAAQRGSARQTHEAGDPNGRENGSHQQQLKGNCRSAANTSRTRGRPQADNRGSTDGGRLWTFPVLSYPVVTARHQALRPYSPLIMVRSVVRVHPELSLQIRTV